MVYLKILYHQTCNDTSNTSPVSESSFVGDIKDKRDLILNSTIRI